MSETVRVHVHSEHAAEPLAIDATRINAHFAMHCVDAADGPSGRREYWCVTHIPTGSYVLRRVPSEAHARELGTRLYAIGEQLGVDWTADTPEGVFGTLERLNQLEAYREKLLAEQAELMEQNA